MLHPHPPDRLLRHTLAGAIGLYQTHLSPHKGFHCAHRIHHGGLSCSQYCKQTILDLGPIAAWPQIRRRFRDCKQAAQTLQSNRMQRDSIQRQPSQSSRRYHSRYQAGDSDRRNDRRNHHRNDRPGPCTERDCRLDPCQPDCISLGCSSADSCDSTGLDCGGLDCGGLDCLGCSF